LLKILDYNFISDALIKLQTESLKTSEQIAILNNVKEKLSGKFLNKLQKSLQKNPDLEKFLNIENMYDFKVKTKFAPLVSVDVERSFSKYKEILSDKRQNMTTKTIEHLNVTCFNKFFSN